MSYSHNKYRHREYRQRDRQYQCHNYYQKKSRHDRDRYYDNRYNRKKALGYQQSQSHSQSHARSVYQPSHSQSHLQYYQQFDSYSHSQQSDASHPRGSGYSNDSYDSYQSHSTAGQNDWYSESVDDWRYDEGEDEDEYYVPPLSPLDLERKQYQLYIKKNSAVHHIYLYQSDAKNNGAKTNSLDIRAAEAKNVNHWNKYVEITNGIKQSYLHNNLQKINILEIGCGSGNNVGIYEENASCIAQYVGIDASRTCIESAMNKYRDLPFNARFICHNIFAVAAADHPVCKGRFDLINIDLSSLHNAFKCTGTLLMFLRLISEWTHCKSLLMCSFVRDDIIMERFNALSRKNSILNLISSDNCVNSNDNMLWQNRYQSISMKRMDFNAVRNVYNGGSGSGSSVDQKSEDEYVGRPYIYYQMHSVDNITEYFICFDYLSKMLFKHCNMKLVYRHNASEIYSKYSDTFTDLKGRMVPHSSTWTKDERQVINTYGYALFQRQP